MSEKRKFNVMKQNDIQKRIYTIREKQVMLDRDLAELYEVETKVLNQSVKRNIERFPEEFRFQLIKEEYESLRSQFVTLKDNGRGKHRKYLPYVFTEQGVAMLSAVLKSNRAIEMSIKIMTAFFEMRKFILKNAEIFQKINNIEKKQINYQFETEKKFEEVFNALESEENIPKQGIFFNGQIFDAYKFVSDLIRSAKKSIILIDNYVDDTVLTLFIKRKKDVRIAIYTKKITKQLQLDLEKYNAQYEPIEVNEFKNSHDRFLIIDNKEIFHFGASLKDLGKKWFAFSKIEKDSFKIFERLKNI